MTQSDQWSFRACAAPRIDYFSSMPLAGLTVTDGPNTTTTDANGHWELPTTGPLTPTVSGTPTGGMPYTTLYLPTATAGSVEVDQATSRSRRWPASASSSSILNTDNTKALAQVTIVQLPTCPKIAGGTLTVNSPAGALRPSWCAVNLRMTGWPAGLHRRRKSKMRSKN